MLHYAMRLDETKKTLQDLPQLDIFKNFFGLTDKDLGLYALIDNHITGAIWVRQLKAEDGANGFIDSATPILNIAVKPEFRGQGIGTAMLEQLLLEAGALYEAISLSVLKDSKAVKFYKKFGFEIQEDRDEKSPVDGSEVLTMLKKLTKKEVIRPSDGYDPRRWMD